MITFLLAVMSEVFTGQCVFSLECWVCWSSRGVNISSTAPTRALSASRILMEPGDVGPPWDLSMGEIKSRGARV